VRTAVPHAAQFDDLSLALAETGAARRWAMTWAGSTDTPCIPGAWAAVTDENDAPVTLPGVQGPWTHARPLVPDGACEDRVLGAAWRGARGTALLATARAGLELTELDLTSGAQRRWALQPPGARVVTAGFALGERGGLALWQVPGERALRMRRVRADGTPDAVQGTLPAELRLQPERRPLPVAVVGDDAVALVPTTRGAELLRMECGARPRAR
jgi:hypothetical protein